MAARVLYDLAGADPAVRFSPYCWRARLALAHKGLPVETIPWRFTQKDAIAFSGQDKVPVLVDGDRTVVDSFAIARHLDEAYPRTPPLLGGAAGEPAHAFVIAWTDVVAIPAIARMVVADIHDVLAPQDRAYFRASREARFGMALEEAQADRAERLPAFRASLAPLRRRLQAGAFLSGDAPGYVDYAVFGAFQWPRLVSRFELLAEDDPVAAWRERMLDLFDGLARRAPSAA